MIRVRLTRLSTLTSAIVRERSADSPAPPAKPLCIEGVLWWAERKGDRWVGTRPAATLEEGFSYDRPLAVLLDAPADGGQRRCWITSFLRMVMVADQDDFLPRFVETNSSYYQVEIL